MAGGRDADAAPFCADIFTCPERSSGAASTTNPALSDRMATSWTRSLLHVCKLGRSNEVCQERQGYWYRYRGGSGGTPGKSPFPRRPYGAWTIPSRSPSNVYWLLGES